MSVVRSTAPHADVKRVGLDAARSMPGVVAALARDDLPEIPLTPERIFKALRG